MLLGKRPPRATTREMASDALSALCCACAGYGFLVTMWRCPRGSGAYQRQRLKAWWPVLTPLAYVGVFLLVFGAFAVASVSVGLEGQGTELAKRYDVACGLGRCTVQMEVEETMDSPIYVYYEIDNFYQNHRDYLKSMFWPQLHWENTKEKCDGDCATADNVHRGAHNYEEEDWEHVLKANCKPLWKNKGRHLSPCGVVPNTLFDDSITLVSHDMREDRVAWAVDVDNVFQQPLGFDWALVSDDEDDACFADGANLNPKTACAPALCDTYLADRKEPKRKFADAEADERYNKFWAKADLDQCFGYTCQGAPLDAKRSGEICRAGEKTVFVYPDPDRVQYLYETFPEVVSPLVGVKSERFAVWMKIAALPRFRKLYGRIEQTLEKGDVLTFDINSRFDVAAFSGKKSLVVATGASFENVFLWKTFAAVGGACLAVALFFALVQVLAPRRMGAVRYSCLNPRPKDE